MNIIRPSEIRGSIAAPASKSDAQRAIAAATLARGQSVIERMTGCDDVDAALELARAFGASVYTVGDVTHISGGSSLSRNEFDCGESGLSLRLFSFLVALHTGSFTMTGRGTLLRRPLQDLEAALSAFGVTSRSNNGFLPLKIAGPLRRGVVSLDASESSQHVTGLLFALPLCSGDSELMLVKPTSIPYLRMTISVLRRFGVVIDPSESFERFRIPGDQVYVPARYVVEGDWSAAAFLLVAGAIAGEVSVTNLRTDSLQADRAVLDALRRCGAQVTEEQGRVSVQSSELSAFHFDARHAPDLFPPLTALACYCKGTSVLEGAGRLAHKESDRAAALVREFSALGASIRRRGDCIEVTGGTFPGGNVSVHNDHRIAMAASIAALGSRNGVTLDDPSCVSKSYPGFFRDLQTLGVNR